MGSMRVQTAAILVASVLLSHVAGLLFYSLDRQGALAITEATDLAERAAGVSRLLRDLPLDWHERIVHASDSRAFRVWLSPASAVEVPEPTSSELDVTAYLRTQVPPLSDDALRVRFIEETGYRVIPPPFDPASRAGSPALALDLALDAPSVAISLRQGPDLWINFLGLINTPRSLVPELFLANVVSAAIGIALVAFWLVSRVTSPLAQLAEAAEALGRDVSSEPLPTTGPREVAVAANAFNSMQRRLLRLLHGRTELLAGISHDLRTPLTHLRLRMEPLEDTPERDKNLRTLDDMDAIIGTFLSYARASGEVEERARIDLGALVASLCDDLSDMGATVDCRVGSGLVISCRRLAIRRAVTNLVENAVKYGHEARVSAGRQDHWALIVVEDRGPGIAEGDRETVFRPFHRAVPPDSPTSGAGLGLSIAQSIVEDHGGEIRLVDRREGGLRAEVLLPL